MPVRENLSQVPPKDFNSYSALIVFVPCA